MEEFGALLRASPGPRQDTTVVISHGGGRRKGPWIGSVRGPMSGHRGRHFRALSPLGVPGTGRLYFSVTVLALAKFGAVSSSSSSIFVTRCHHHHFPTCLVAYRLVDAMLVRPGDLELTGQASGLRDQTGCILVRPRTSFVARHFADRWTSLVSRLIANPKLVNSHPADSLSLFLSCPVSFGDSACSLLHTISHGTGYIRRSGSRKTAATRLSWPTRRSSLSPASRGKVSDLTRI